MQALEGSSYATQSSGVLGKNQDYSDNYSDATPKLPSYFSYYLFIYFWPRLAGTIPTLAL